MNNDVHVEVNSEEMQNSILKILGLQTTKQVNSSHVVDLREPVRVDFRKTVLTKPRKSARKKYKMSKSQMKRVKTLKSGTTWTPEDDSRLKRLFNENKSPLEMAAILLRSESSIENRLYRIGEKNGVEKRKYVKSGLYTKK